MYIYQELFMIKKGKRIKKYNKSYKEEAIKIYLENEKNIKDTAKDLGIFT